MAVLTTEEKEFLKSFSEDAEPAIAQLKEVMGAIGDRLDYSEKSLDLLEKWILQGRKKRNLVQWILQGRKKRTLSTMTTGSLLG